MTLMTEKEARLRWCPMARAMLYEPQEGQNPSVNRVTSDCNCIASACMAWRVAEKGFKREKTDAETERRFRLEYGHRLTIEPKNWPSSGYDTLVVHERGYCGAFGKVEP